jgi:hypothetical protein
VTKLRFRECRAVTSEVAGSSPVAPVKVLQICSLCCLHRRATEVWAAIPWRARCRCRELQGRVCGFCTARFRLLMVRLATRLHGEVAKPNASAVADPLPLR